MKLEAAESIGFDNVTAEQLRAAFASDAGWGEFIILSRDRDHYLQAAGETDGQYTLEYRDGDAAHHFCAGDAFRKEDLLRAFVSYLADSAQWRSEFNWQKLERKPWWKLW
jgi:hypothetical protein